MTITKEGLRNLVTRTYMKKNNCKYCGGKFKVSTTEYTIRSRHAKKAETTIENLSVNECTICGHVEMPESSERYIEMIREKIRKEMEEQTNHITSVTNEAPTDKTSVNDHLKKFTKMIKKLIG